MLLPLGFVTGWIVAARSQTDTTTAMSALVIAVTIAVVIWLPFFQAVLGETALAAGFLMQRSER